MTFDDVDYTSIVSHIRGGSIIPMRVNSAKTTTELRKQNFMILVAPGLDGTATGSLYLDDGDSLVQPSISDIQFNYEASGNFSMNGSFDYDAGVSIESVVLLGSQGGSKGSDPDVSVNVAAGTRTRTVSASLQSALTINLVNG